MIKVYIASPYSMGDPVANVNRQIDMASALRNYGFTAYIPLMSHFEHERHPRPWGDWIEHDLEWLKVCDCVLRLSGESKGADMEVEYAVKLGIPVFFNLEVLIAEIENILIDNK